jgi:hypothetical protein
MGSCRPICHLTAQYVQQGGLVHWCTHRYLSTLVIRSLAVPEVCETFDARATELSTMAQQQGTFAAVTEGSSGEAAAAAGGEATPGAGEGASPAKVSLTAKQVRWLMHCVRAELCGWFADVQVSQ